MSDLNAQKASAEDQASRLKARKDALVTEIEDLKGSREHLEALENGVEQRDQTLARLEYELKDITNALDQEKNSKDKLETELLAKSALVAELQQKLEPFQSNHTRLENEVEKSKNEITQLQEQLANLKSKQASAAKSPVVPEMSRMPPLEGEEFEKEAESHNPTAIIDWIIKKKSE